MRQEQQLWFRERVARLSKKYHNSTLYDYMSEQEELEETRRKREEKYVWKSDFSAQSLAEEVQKVRGNGGVAAPEVRGKSASSPPISKTD